MIDSNLVRNNIGANQNNTPEELYGKNPKEVFSSDDIKNVWNGISYNREVSPFFYINRYKTYETIDPLTTGISYVFFTKPDLNIVNKSTYYPLKNYEKDDFFMFLYKNKEIGHQIIGCLQSNPDGLIIPKSRDDFIIPLTNLSKGFTPKDVSLETVEAGENFIGNKMVMADMTHKSQTIDTFDITFTETSDMLITYLAKAWIDYMHNVRKGIFLTKGEHIVNKRLDYTSSMFYFLLGEDGETIKFYSKYTGVFPGTVQYSTFEHSLGSHKIVDVNINFHYSFKEDLNPLILLDFNKVASLGQITSANTNGSLTPYNEKERAVPISHNWYSSVIIQKNLETHIPKLVFGGDENSVDTVMSAAANASVVSSSTPIHTNQYTSGAQQYAHNMAQSAGNIVAQSYNAINNAASTAGQYTGNLYNTVQQYIGNHK